jgi:glycosyltransferase involved in cell wall biosynthesis
MRIVPRVETPARAHPSMSEMSQLNVLLVTYAFPPAGGVGTLRAASLARYFPEFDIRFDVLTTRNPSSVGNDDSHLRDIPASVTIHRTMTLDLPFGVKKWLKRTLSRGHKQTTPTAPTIAAPSKPSFLKRALQDLLLPDPQVTWLPILTRAARHIVRYRKIDLVLITAAPYSNVLVAERLRKAFPNLPIVLDFRDEWLATAFDVAAFQFSSSSAKAKTFARNAEANAVKAATAVVSVTEAADREIRARYPQQPDSKFLYIPNGFDATRLRRSSEPPTPRADGKILITYVGSIYGSTEPTRLVEALQSLPPEIKNRFLFRFIGQIEDAYRGTLLSLGEMVELRGFLPQHEALAAMNDTDYVLLISHDRLNISAKFYDYIGAGKPILACVHPDGDIRLRLEELRAGWWADNANAASMRQLFLDAAARGPSLGDSFRPDVEKIATYERKPIARNYAALLHSIAGEKIR